MRTNSHSALLRASADQIQLVFLLPPDNAHTTCHLPPYFVQLYEQVSAPGPASVFITVAVFDPSKPSSSTVPPVIPFHDQV